MLTPRSETNLLQRRRSQSLAGKYLLGTQRDFSHNFHRIWVQHQRIKASNATPLLIVRWSYDSMKEEEQRNKCYVFILPRAQSFASNMHRTNRLDISNFQGSLLLALSSVITFATRQGDYLRRLHQSPRYTRDLLLCVHQQTHKSHTVYVNKLQNIRRQIIAPTISPFLDDC